MGLLYDAPASGEENLAPFVRDTSVGRDCNSVTTNIKDLVGNINSTDSDISDTSGDSSPNVPSVITVFIAVSMAAFMAA